MKKAKLSGEQMLTIRQRASNGEQPPAAARGPSTPGPAPPMPPEPQAPDQGSAPAWTARAG